MFSFSSARTFNRMTFHNWIITSSNGGFKIRTKFSWNLRERSNQSREYQSTKTILFWYGVHVVSRIKQMLSAFSRMFAFEGYLSVPWHCLIGKKFVRPFSFKILRDLAMAKLNPSSLFLSYYHVFVRLRNSKNKTFWYNHLMHIFKDN